MATREENLKKINEQLEKFTDAELEQISGGSQSIEEIMEDLFNREYFGPVKKDSSDS